MAYSSHDILGFDYIQKYVGNARHTTYYYCGLYGFEIAGYMGPETGVRDRVSYLLKQNELLLAVTAPIVPDHAIHTFLSKHGDGVREITFKVKDVYEAHRYALEHGAENFRDPAREKDSHGTFIRGSLKIYGDTILTLTDRSNYTGLIPGYQPYEGVQVTRQHTNLLRIDHIVGNVETGKMDYWASWFEDKLDLETFVHFDKGDISTQYSALVSKVVRSKNTAVRLPINEPAEGLKKSQIEEYLDVNYGPGVQHIAIETDDILHSIAAMRDNGVEFIPTPSSYYDVIQERAAGIPESLTELERLSILMDKDERGYLLQLFTQPVGDRPTLFYEIIQRRGCDGFGQNNFQALFEAIEREQAKRGNL
ncbi:MAG: 4-hydroxyphenylpyruvate dioxygenase [Acidobacteria bacterium]|nr:4-hydroxyphenylpyruvate dioxygenase [Acidobacteriota bacterium]MCB9397022.1 4-hydroxyphenylpyruvate dioxygenase [Acidobacteriota bacterium]